MQRRLRPADLAIGPLLILLGLLALAVLGGVIALEAQLLRMLRWGSRGRCLLDSTLANVVSTAIGLLAFVWLDDTLGDWFTPIGWLVMAALSIAIEAVVLHLRRPAGHPPVLRTAVLVNIPSYVLLFIFVRSLQ